MHGRNSIRSAWLLFFACIIVYSLTDFGAILSPDSELVFRQARNLAEHGSLSVSELENWKGFGIARAQDDRLYPVFGAGEAIALAPVIKLVESLHLHRADIGKFYTPFPFPKTNTNQPDERHALRFFCSFFNIVITAFAVLVLHRILSVLGFESSICSFVCILYAFGSLAWPYADTFFSEPLATLFVLCSFWFLLLFESHQNRRLIWWSGIFAGSAAAVHITAILAAPFLMIYCIGISSRGKNTTRNALTYLSGLFLLLCAIGYYNFYRFGNIFETGRTVDPFAANKYGYGAPVLPFSGLYGILVGGQKGLFVFCPVILLSVYFWRHFHEKRRLLSWVIGCMCVFRVIFIASRLDWHGGFCLGPRLLVMIIPFLMIPIAFGIQTLIEKQSGHAFLLVFSAIIVSQQLYFSFGEIFSFYSNLRDAINLQITERMRDMFYLTWSNSPLFSLHHGLAGPVLLRKYFVRYPFPVWLGSSVLLGSIIILIQNRLISKANVVNPDWTNAV